jgi:hypothetical protein
MPSAAAVDAPRGADLAKHGTDGRGGDPAQHRAVKLVPEATQWRPVRGRYSHDSISGPAMLS